MSSASKKKNLINTPSNWFTAEDEKYDYICDTGQSFSIYKLSKEGSEPLRLNEDESWYLNLAGGWLYYCNKSDRNFIYKLRTDGTERTRVCTVSAGYLNVAGDWIYYCKDSDGKNICKIKTDGSGQEIVTDDAAEYLFYDAGWLFYVNLSDKGKIYKMKTDGSERTKLCDDMAKYLNVLDDWVYYANESKEGRLYKIHLDGVREFIVTDDKIRSFKIIDNNWVYFTNDKDYSKLYKVRLDGTERTRLNDEVTSEFIIHGGYVFYTSLKKICRVKLDGTGDQIIGEADGYIAYFALCDDYLYYQNGSGIRDEGDRYIYRINLDGTGNTAISSEASKGFQIHDGWVYYRVHEEYSSATSEGTYCKVRVDGKDETTLFTESHCSDFTISGNKIFYIFYKSRYFILKSFNIDDGNIKTIVDAPVGKYLVFGDQLIFYAEKTDSYAKSKFSGVEQGKIYIMNINNGHLQPLFDPKLKYGEDKYKTWDIINNWLYYTDNIGRVCRIRLDGSDDTRLTENKAGLFVIQDNWLYYINRSDNRGLYRLDLDGSNRVELNNERSESIIATEDFIYYASADKDSSLFRIRPDGKGRKKVIDEEVAYINCLSDSIYYLNNNQGGKLFISNMTGTTNKAVGIEELKNTTIDGPQLKIGNSAGNIINNGIAAIDGDWQYYYHNYALYKEHSNGSGQMELVGEGTSFINIYDGWIYYASAGSLNIYKIRTDGSGKTIVNSDRSAYLNVVGEWIYYVSKSDEGRIYRIRTDGSEKTRIGDVRATCLNYTDRWLIFINLEDASPKEVDQFDYSEPDFGRIYKMKHDGSDLSPLGSDESEHICVAEDWVCYLNRNDNNSIHRVNVNNETVEKVNDLEAECLNYAGDWLYFVSDGINKIRLNGTGLKKVCDSGDSSINVIGEWVYFINASDLWGDRVGRVKTDGSGYALLFERGRAAKHLRVKFEDGKSFIYRTFDLNIKLGSKVMVEGKKAGLVGEIIEEDAKYNKSADAQYISEVISYGTGKIADLSDQAKESIQNLAPKKAKSNFIVEVKKSNRRNSKAVYCKTKDLDIDVGTIVAYQTTYKYGRYQEEIGIVTKRRVKGVSAASAFPVLKKFSADSNFEDLRTENAKKEAAHREKYKAAEYRELLKPESAALFEDVLEKDADSDLVAVLFDDLRTYSYKNTDPKLNIGSVVQVTRAGILWEGNVVMMNVKPIPSINYLSILKVISYGEDES